MVGSMASLAVRIVALVILLGALDEIIAGVSSGRYGDMAEAGFLAGAIFKPVLYIIISVFVWWRALSLSRYLVPGGASDTANSTAGLTAPSLMATGMFVTGLWFAMSQLPRVVSNMLVVAGGGHLNWTALVPFVVAILLMTFARRLGLRASNG